MPTTAELVALPELDVHARTLDNGLRVQVNPDAAAPIAAVNLWYRVGSRDETVGTRDNPLTGFAHLFEHLMFEGSRDVAPGEHFSRLERVGASLNATTSFDRTNYFETVPVEHLELALWLEANRMGGLRLTTETLDNQREVVKEEKRQRYDNPPAGTRWLLRQRLLFPSGHHYHHPVIGSMDDLDGASLDDARAFFATWYAPDNCVLTVVGDVEPERVFAAVEREFGGIEAAGAVPEPRQVTLDGPLEPVQRDLHDRVAHPKLVMAWRTPPLGDAAFDALSVAATILGYGRGSLLYDALVVERQLAAPSAAYLGLSPLVGGVASASLEVDARDGVEVREVEDTVAATIRRLADDGPSEEQMERAQALIAAAELGGFDDVTSRADTLSRYATQFGRPEAALEHLPDLLAVTPERVRRAAAVHLADAARVTLRYLPGEPDPAQLEGLPVEDVTAGAGVAS